MQKRWFLSQFFADDTPGGHPHVPVCTAYGADWTCPTLPADPSTGSALVLMWCNTHQLDAAKQDTRVVVLPQAYDPTPLPDSVTSVYTSWGATSGMSLGTLLAKLEETEPAFGMTS